MFHNHFIPSSQTTQTTAYGGVCPAKNRDSQGWLPLTVKQLSDFINGGVEINNVKLVGMVSNRKERINEVTLTLDDKTGRMDCHRWVNDYIDSKEMAEIRNGTFAEIQGHLKGFQGKKHLEAFSVRPVTDIDQVAYHFMECMHGPGSNSAQPQITNAAITNGSSYGISQKVLDFFSIPENKAREKGVHLNEFAQNLKVPLQKIMEAIVHLEEDGLVYSTIDKFHYKSSWSDD
ncbi:hypothetical protein MKW98_020282 [Papaver atlanticum]|uniref:Replication protein A C-terminal domain-containing protein n=1 Tax=Papaver atlanticum TaxID=357466 RepID=A0AAD4TE77_9MAGN|nr:hypothetical protein MKW98_020282 [Papaver atlanticum]